MITNRNLKTFACLVLFAMGATRIFGQFDSPFLVSSSPAMLAMGVPVSSPVSFTFDVAMGPGYAIEWSENLTAANFTYAWSADKKTLTCTYQPALPANAAIFWTLNPDPDVAGFANQSGTPLASGEFTGFFMTGAGTGGGTNDPCTSTNQQQAGFSVTKSVDYVQRSAAPPVIDPDSGAMFGAMASGTATRPLASASLQYPTGKTVPLTNLFGSTFFLPDLESYPTQEAMDAQYPNGIYVMNAAYLTGGMATMPLNLPPNGYPPIPQINNFDQTQNIAPAADFTVLFNGLLAPALNDSISFTISDLTGLVFSTPNPCIPRYLPNTATSVTIPANTLSAGKVYTAHLHYFKVGTLNSNTVPGMVGSSGFSKSTTFQIKTAGGTQPTAPRFTGYQRLPDGSFMMQVTGQKGVMYQLQYTTDFLSWKNLAKQPQILDVMQFIDAAPAADAYRFYRVIVAP